MKCSSLRASPGGGMARWCHWSIRWVWVKEPSFSVCAAAGNMKTSVRMSSGRTSPRSISGAVRQKSAVSIIEKSRTTSQSSSRRPRRCTAPFIEPTAGFSPITK